MEVLYPRCAGLDVHKETVVACVRLAGSGPSETQVQTFSTTTNGLLAVADWLTAARVRTSRWSRRACTGSRCNMCWRRISSSCW
jgi:hypothetical protein